MDQYQKGDKVLHKNYGMGTVEAISMSGKRARVRFANKGAVELDLDPTLIRKIVLKDEPSYTEYLNNARVLYYHNGHESHVFLEIGYICIPSHMHQCTDLWIPEDKENAPWTDIIGIHLTITEASIESYVPEENNPLFGIHKTLWWGNEEMIGWIETSTRVAVRRPDSMTMSPDSPFDWRGVDIKGVGRVMGFYGNGGIIVASCGVMFFVFTYDDHPEISSEKGDLVKFKGYPVAYRRGW